MRLPVLTNRPILGTFGKGIDGSVSINFCQSGGKYCDKDCAYHPQSNVDSSLKGSCYAVRLEARGPRKNLRTKLVRHSRTKPENVARRALSELNQLHDAGIAIPWVRVSTAGSVPNPHQATPGFIEALKELLEWCMDKEIPVHFPVETKAKAAFYRTKLAWRVVVRESCTNYQRFMDTGSAATIVAGDETMNRIERVIAAKKVAKDRMESTGRRTVVCPAVASRYLNNNIPNDKAKCGNCTACALPNVDVVYPLH